MPGYALIWVFAALFLVFFLVVTLIYYIREAYRWLRKRLRRRRVPPRGNLPPHGDPGAPLP